MNNKVIFSMFAIFVVTYVLLMFVPKTAGAHCDSLDGPVISTAKQALQNGDVTPVLKWVKKEHETQIRKAFKKTLSVRKTGNEARELADMYFFETLVRLHRAGEGAPYTGLKPAGSVEPAVAEADNALKKGAVEHLVRDITKEVAEGIQKRFDEALAKKKYAEESIVAGREFIEAYVKFVHYVEGLYEIAAGKDSGHAHAETPQGGSH